ncbi:MAG: hypothetical protein Q7V63_00450 [Gammaproteobacteria bacterium]|nr:hypothetical protein [Gammaproteobacteria bacterium]
MYPVYLFLMALAISIVEIVFFHQPMRECLLLNFLLINTGLQGIVGFVGHFFNADIVAKGIGWPQGNPFQTEIAFANLGMGALGLTCLFLKGDFWLATIIMRSIYSWGAAYTHVVDLFKKNNKAKYNAGPVLYFGLFYPFLLIGLYWLK